MSWTLSGGDSADFYLISITTNAPQTPYGGLLNITTGSVTQHELTGFMADYEYNITVRGVNCGSQEGRESEPLTITPQGILESFGKCTYHPALAVCYQLAQFILKIGFVTSKKEKVTRFRPLAVSELRGYPGRRYMRQSCYEFP